MPFIFPSAGTRSRPFVAVFAWGQQPVASAIRLIFNGMGVKPMPDNILSIRPGGPSFSSLAR
jgi:hypothetical protein